MKTESSSKGEVLEIKIKISLINSNNSKNMKFQCLKKF